MCKAKLRITKSELEHEKVLRKGERSGRINNQRRSRAHIQKSMNTGGHFYKAIGYVESPFPSRCGTPRQPNLVTAAKGYIRFDKTIIQHEHFRELSAFSHIWVIWIFHENTNIESKTPPAKIAPPRLGGVRVGCLSTRSPHRPNPIGLSVLQVKSVNADGIEVLGVDMVHGTPILDVKPYLHYDVIPASPSHTAYPGETLLRMPSWIVEQEVPSRRIQISLKAMHSLEELVEQRSLRFCEDVDHAVSLISQVLQQDIRGVHQGRGKRGSSEVYRCRLDAMQISFVTRDEDIDVQDVAYLDPKHSTQLETEEEEYEGNLEV